jgi:hypothetical protein
MTSRRDSKLWVGSDPQTRDVIELRHLRSDGNAIGFADEYASSVRLTEREARELRAILRGVLGHQRDAPLSA